MSAPIVTGAVILRSKKILTPAEIRGLETTPVLIAPAMPGKSLAVIGTAAEFLFGTQTWDVTADAQLTYGPGSGNNTAIGTLDLVLLLNHKTESQFSNPAVGNSVGPEPSTNTVGLGIWLSRISGTFITGSATAATVDPAHKGLLYALNDTGTLDDGVTSANYTVTGVGAGGLVTTVTVSGGAGFIVSGTYLTTVVTGSGDGTLRLTVTAITNLGDGTLELDVLYQPI